MCSRTGRAEEGIPELLASSVSVWGFSQHSQPYKLGVPDSELHLPP